jgi:hypothetical protein
MVQTRGVRQKHEMRRPNGGPGVLLCLLAAGLAACGARSMSRVVPTKSSAKIRPGTAGHGLAGKAGTPPREQQERTPTIVIGFVGGFVRHGDSVHSPVQVAARIRGSYPAGVYVEVYENRRRENAHRRILELLGKGLEGKLSESVKQEARVIIYGMSWGGSETVALARELKREQIPVLLTVQIDSVAKLGQNDEVIPPNVAEAANFYQTDGLLHGRPEIRAEDGSRTRIVGNFHYAYKAKSLNCEEYPWYDRLFTKYHTEIECDPEVWNRVELLIRAKLPPVEGAPGKAAQSPN